MKQSHLRHYLWHGLLGVSAGVMTMVSSDHAIAQTYSHDQYLSTGDNHYVGNWLPLDSPAAIDASFDLLNDVFGTNRVYWRGLQDQLLVESNRHPEHVVPNRFFSHLDSLINQQGLNDYAVQAAHARGMEIWGQTSLYDWGSTPDMGTYGFPSQAEHPLRTNNPEWAPVDKYGLRTQGGPLEYAYSGARAASTSWVDNQLQQTGYDGVLFHTYAENFGARYGDEFGFSDPIVNEFKNRYGVDIRYQDFNKQDWYDLRGEYTTTFFQELHDTLSPQNKQIGVAINPLDTDRPQLWLGNSHFSTAGNLTMDWQQWAQDGTVDQLVVWGGTSSGPDAMSELIAGTQGTGVEMSIMTSQPDAFAWEPFKQQGHGVTQFSAYDWQYILASDIPVQPKSSLNHSDPYRRMRALAQVIDGSMAATTSEILPLVNDANLLNRRSALTALGKIGDTNAIAALENALDDPEVSVRNAAIYGLLDASRTSSVTPILQAIEDHEGFALMQGAYSVLRQQDPQWTAELLDAVENSTNDSVRMVAMRSLVYHRNNIQAIDVPTIIAATQDPEPEVRAFAVDLLGNLTHLNSPAAVQSLVETMQSDDTVVASRAATALSYSLQFHAPAARARRTELIGLLADEFASLGDGTQRADKDWAHRPLGNSLVFLGSAGVEVLTDFMNQRTDRRLSELAWLALYIPQRSHQVSLTTEADDAYAHYKRPRWDSVVVATDDFDGLTLGTSIHGQSPETGAVWSVLSANSSQQIIQDQYARSGNALRAVRNPGDNHLIKLDGFERDVEAAEITMVTARADWLRLNESDSTVFKMGLGGLFGPSAYVDLSGQYRIWQTDGTETGGSYIDSGFFAGTDAWETIEMELTLDPVTDDFLTGSYDVYLTREAGGSLDAITRTLIAQDIDIFPIAERTLLSLLISNQPNGTHDVITYWDNVSLRVDPLLDIVTTLSGDYDNNGLVGEGDLALVLEFWGAAIADGESPDAAWINAEAITGSLIGQDELALVLQNWGNSSQLQSQLGEIATATGLTEDQVLSLVPEPAGVSIVILGLLGGLARRPRR